ncbi:MAG: threonylcarbamoyl-AMP synthase [Brevefilum sp.]|nr:threonylcarbamoyl-AMP synthase [Brevefilum sp.]
MEHYSKHAMHTLTLKIDDPQAIPTAKGTIHTGGLIAFPTDTIYGVAADPFNPEAIQRIYAAKERPDEKALPVLISSLAQLDGLVLFVDERVRLIANAFWPGPLTLILPKNARVPTDLTPYPTIGVRMPNLGFTLALLNDTGPLATTSANISGGPNPVDAASVMAHLGGKIELILDGGPTPGPTASTVADLSGAEITILRQGPITLANLQALFDEA